MKSSTNPRHIGAHFIFTFLNLCLAGVLAAQTTITCPADITTCHNPVVYPSAYVSVPNTVPTSLPNHSYLGSYNGHAYFLSNTTYTIAQTQNLVSNIGGHLAAITSSGENTFIKNALPTGDYQVWIGLNDLTNEGTYVWTTGESFSYSNWASGEPNNETNGIGSGGEDYTALHNTDGKWGDYASTYCANPHPLGCSSVGTHSYKYILEIAPSDNFTDHPAAALISGPASGSNFPTGTTTVTLGYGGTNCSFNVTLPTGAGTPVVTCPPNITTCTSPVNYSTPLAYIPSTTCLPTQLSGYTFLGALGGHHYFLSNNSNTWLGANEAATWLGGYLVSINSAGENDFILQKTFFTNSDIFTGLNDRLTEGTFVWENGDPLSYTNWETNEPNNSSNEDNTVLLWATGKWNDISDSYYYSNGIYLTNYRRYVVELEMGDCKEWVTPTLVSGPASGAAFSTGTTAVTWGYGGTNCTFNVTVSNPTPTIDCPANIITCTNPVYYTKPSATVPSTGCLPTNINTYKFIGVYNGHHYFRAQIPATFSNAKLKATGLGGYLASITTAGENDFLRNNLKSVGGDFLIGLNDSITENTFVWANGEAFSYSNWVAGEPNNGNGGEDAVTFQASYLGRWNDVTTSTSLPFIVEFQSGTSYEESVTPVLTAGLASGSDFPAGNSTVTWSMGNSNCTFTVTKNTPSASLTCPPNITVCANPVNYAQPSGRVNCTNATLPTTQSGMIYLGTYGSSAYFYAAGSNTWATARADAHLRGGHLATISSSGENDFLKTAVSAITSNPFFIGMNDEATEGTFVWEDGEPNVYTNWLSGEPNNGGTGEDYATFSPSSGTWNDIGANNTAYTVVEFDSRQDVVPTLSAGFASGANFPLGSTNVTYSYGSSTCTFNISMTNPAPTATHCPANITVCSNPVYYPAPTADLSCTTCAMPTSLPGFTSIGTYNGHAYFRSNTKTTWVAAEAIAVGFGGHLASIGSSGENDFVKTAVAFVNASHWMGGNDLDTEGTFEWTDGSSFSYTNWATNEPNNSNNEDAIAMGTDGKWTDLLANTVSTNTNLYFIVEFDCPTATLMNLSAGSLASGSNFPLGTSTVTYNWGGSNCSFNVTRNTPSTTLTCPPNITTCASQVFYATPSVSGTCPSCVLPTGLDGFAYIGAFGGHHYFLADTAQMFWPTAKNRALQLGGYLATISNRDENTFLKNFLAPLNINAFIGLNDAATEGTYVWANGEPLSYTRWNTGEPNNNFNEDYGQFVSIKGRWNDLSGITPSYFILEFDGCDAEPTATLSSGPASGGTFSNGVTTVTWSSGSSSCSFTVNVVPPASPTNVTATPSTVTCGESSQLNATTASGGSIRWFTQNTGGTSIGTSQSGQNFGVTPTATTTYYAETADSSLFGQSTQTLVDTFDFTGSVQYWTAPDWVDSLVVEANGAGGGSNLKDGGPGGRVTTTIPVTPGTTYTLVVGGAGQAGVNKMGGGGGGWSGLTLANGQHLIVAGGGGGAGGAGGNCPYSTAGGAGGGPSGGQSASNCNCGTGGIGGAMTDTVAVGTGGSYQGQNGSATSGGIGGNGGAPNNFILQAGGGGGSFGLLGAASSFTVNGTNNLVSGGAGGFGGGGSGGSNNVTNGSGYEFTKSPGGGGGGGFHAGSGGGGPSSCSSQCGGGGGGGGSSYVVPEGANVVHTQGGGADPDQNGWLVIRYKAQPQLCAAPARTPVTVTFTAPILTTQPTSVSTTAGGNATFTVATDGSNPTYQWQEKTGGGSFANIANGGIYSGATSATLTLTGVTAGMDNYQYRCIVGNGGCPPLTSDAATLTIISCAATGSVWYVNASAASSGTGASWACAFKSLQNALEAASSGQEIWVKSGTYKPTKDPFGNALPTDPRDKTFYLKNGVAVYGGFAGTETLRSQRDWTANPTILSGDIGAANDSTDNCYHVVLSVSDASTTVLDGFNVTKANASASSSITVETKTITRYEGGGLNTNSSMLTVANCTLASNKAQYGGGVFNEGGSTTYTNCTFTGNYAKDNFSGQLNGGGMNNRAATLTLTGCTFSNNTSGYGGGICNTGTCTLTLTGCNFLNNYTGSGGGIFNANQSSLILNQCKFSGNTAWFYGGGGIYNDGACTGTVTNCLFSGNKASAFAGVYTGSLAYTNCTFSGNWNITANNSPTIHPSSGSFKNCVFWNNRSGTVTGSVASSVGSSTAAFTYCLAQAVTPSGTGNLDGITNAANSNYPNFVTPLDPTTAPSTSGDFHLTNCSPVVNLGTNTGAPTTDLFGNTRPFGAAVDLGVHELQSAAAAAPGITCPANQTATAPYTLADFTALATPSGTCTPILVTQSPAIGTSLAVGTHTITMTAKASNNATATCSFTVTLNSNCPATGTVWYVNPSAASGGTGASWDCGFQNLQDAIDAASSGHEIWVKAGTYVPTKDPFGNTSPSDPRNKTFYLKDGVAIYGGFAGIETARSQRNWVANVTKLNGDITSTPNIADNAYHVVLTAGDANTTIMDGFTVELGYANGSVGLVVEGQAIPADVGSGICALSSAMSIANCILSNNRPAWAGGGIFGDGSSMTISNCTISNNGVIANRGGGIHFQGTSTPTFNNCVISNNSSTFGGGAFLDNCNPTFTQCNFQSNTGSGSADKQGGGMYVSGTSNPILNACKFLANKAGNGAGIYHQGAGLTLNNCLFSGNKIDNTIAYGGALYCNQTSATLNNCTISGNFAGGLGGGLFNLNANVTLVNTIIWNNRAGSTTGSANANMYNSSSTSSMSYSLIQSITDGTNNNLNGSTYGSNSNYPDFVTPLDPAAAPSTSGDFHLAACSPVVNMGATAGAPATDLFGNARPFGAAVDMGIHELQTAQTAPVAICKNATVQLDGTGSATLAVASVNNNSTGCQPLTFSVSPSTFTCTHWGTPQTVTLTVTGINMVSSTCTAVVTVADAVLPNALCRDLVRNLGANGSVSVTMAEVNNLSNDNCGTVNLVSVSPSSFTCSNIGANTVTLTVNDGHGNSNTCNAAVTIADVTAPTALCQNISMNLNAAGSASITTAQINNGSSDNCGIATLSVVPNSFTCANVGNQTVTLTVTDVNNLASTCTALVTVSDNTNPTAICQNVSVNLNASGTASVTSAQVNNGSSDNCGIASLALSTTSFTCANVGANPVTLTVTDNNSRTSTCTATLTVTDATNPGAVCQNITVNVDGSGNASITGAQVDGGSSDNCGIASRSVTPNTFTASNIGPNTVTLTVTDNNSRTATCTAIVTVTNTNLPNAVCQPYTAVLGANGSVTITPANVNGGSTAVGGIASMSVLPNTLTCANLGTNTVVLTVLGNNGLTAMCNATVTVQDNTAPTVVCQNISVNLNGNTAGITASQVLNAAASSDNCGTVNAVSVSPNTFNCGNLGANTVILTANDGHNNSASCTAIVTVNDATAPTAICQNVSVNLNGAGAASVGVAQVNNGSSDNCGSVNLVSVVPGTFTCSNIGPNTVTLTVNDGHGNSANCTAVVTVNDNLAPSALCRDIVVQLNGSGNASITASQVNNGSSDNCALGTLSVSPNTFTLANLGVNTVTVTVPDTHGNSSSCTAQVTVENNQLPNAVCQNITRNLSANGTLALTAADVDGGSTALGGIASRSVSPTTLNCTNLGSNTVSLTIVGNNGQQASCNAIVTVNDATAPTALCRNVSVNLSGSTATVTAAQVNNGSSDNCTVNLTALTPSIFTCSNLGANTVTLTVSDNSSNSAICTAAVTVSDATAPTAVCRNVSVNLSGSTATVTAAQVNNGSSDNCTVNLTALTPSNFTCSNLGANTVTLTVSDNSSNSATCTAVVTVSDATAPTAVCRNVSVNLSAAGTATVTAAQVNNGSSDNCTVNLTSLTPSNFTCSNLGANTVTLTVSDNSSNTALCTAVVTVNDATAPTAVCRNVSVNLIGNAATVTAAQVNNGSSDNCTVNLTSLTPSNFTCSNLGANTVTLTVSDNSSNSATCNAIVTVNDATAPTALCRNVSVNLSGSTATVTAAQVNNGSSDNCTVNLTSLTPGNFTCSNLGANTVTLTVSDNNSNSATCTAVVTVSDATAPTAVCRNVSVNLSAAGTAIITAAQVNNGSSDNCTVNLTSLTPSNFTCSNLGANTVTLTVSDNNSNTALCTAVVTVSDNTAPTAVCRNVSVNLSGSTATVTAAQVNNGSSDNCTVNLTSLTPSNFTCSNLGANTVTLTVSDNSSNTATCTAVVTVSDATAPTAVCRNVSVNLSAAGTATVTAAQVNNGSSDNCTVNLTSLTPSNFTCSNLGANTVTLTVSDNSSNTATCTAVVTVSDNTAPTALCKAATVQIPVGLTATLAASAVDNNSTDNCGIASRLLNATLFNCNNLGTTTVVLTVTDVNGLSSTCSATVTVTDPNSYCCAAPVAICKPATVLLNSSGSASISVAAVNNNSTYDCGLLSMTVNPNSVSCANVGANTVTLTVTDINNRSSQCTATVTVTDPILPSIVCPANIVRNTDVNQCTAVVTYTNPTFSDNCSGVTLTRTSGPASGSQFNKGTTMVNWRATDLSGNSSICGFTITVNDNQAPTITCPANQTKNVDAGQCTAVATYVTPLSTDNCTGASAALYSGLASGVAFPKGANAIVWQATDGSGLTSRCTFTITVNDNQAPVITCPGNQAKSTDAGLCTAAATYATPTFTDNCVGGSVAIQSGLPSGSAFPKGTNTVVWRATDGAGLTKTCAFNVTVNDTQAPTITCPANQAKTTDPNLCTAVSTYNLATFTDNCTGGSVIKQSGLSSGAAFPKGTSQVVFKATDAAGNQSLCTMTVTVTDTQLPTVDCPANLVVAGTTTNGVCSATVTYTTPAASDNCTLQSSFLWSGMASGSVFPAGVTTNIWKATDETGLTATCAFTVTVGCGTNGSSKLDVRSSKFEMPTIEYGYPVNMRLIPNPATTTVMVSVEGLTESGGQLTVFDAQGRVVWQQANVLNPTSSIQVSDLPAGIYQVRLLTENGMVTKSLMVNRL